MFDNFTNQNENRKLRACVTGATGCVGRNIVDKLLEHGWEVTVIHRRSSDLSKLAGCDVKFVEMDLTIYEETVSKFPPGMDAVFHAAANVSHWPLEHEQQWEDNVICTRNLAYASMKAGVKRFIFTSTGAARRCDYDINNGYINSKKCAEDVLLNMQGWGLDVVILRPIIVVGKYDYNNYSQIFSLIKNGKIFVNFPGIIQFVHAEDVAECHIMAYHNGKSGGIYYLHGEETTWADCFQRIKKIVGSNCRLVSMPTFALKTIAAFMLWKSYITRKVPVLTPELVDLVNEVPMGQDGLDHMNAADLGYKSRSLDESLDTCYKWLVEEGKL